MFTSRRFRYRNAISNIKPGDMFAYGEAGQIYVMNYKGEKQPIGSAAINSLYGNAAYQRIIHLPVANQNEFPTGSEITVSTGPAITVSPGVTTPTMVIPDAAPVTQSQVNTVVPETGSADMFAGSANPALDPAPDGDQVTTPVIQGSSRAWLIGIVVVGGLVWLGSKFTKS